MPLLIQYLVKLSVSLAIVWLFYQFVLRKLTFYNSNRWYLAAYTLLSFLIPFINIAPLLENNKIAGNEVVQFIPSVHQYTIALEEATQCPVPIWSTNYDKWDWMAFGLMLGAVIFFLRFIIRCISFFNMRRKARLISGDGMKLYQVNDNIIPFSFGNAVFINSELHTEEELQEIIRHEFVHVKQKHTLDIIWSEWLCIINWYNPFAWLLKASIRQNLEFIADNKVLENGVSKKQYQYLLLKVIGNNQYSIAQKFNFSSLKKRIAMMNRLKSAKLHLVKFLFVLPLVAVLLISFRKQIGDTLTQDQKNATLITAPAFISDSVPVVTEPNEKGYIINIRDNKGNCTIVVKDKNGKEVERLLLTKWNDNEKYYEDKYGDIPPPPPPVPPAPPTPPSVPDPLDLPPNVKSIDVNNGKATVILKDGTKEKYDLTDPERKKVFESKYGSLPTPPVPPAPPINEVDPGLKTFLERNPDVKEIGRVYNNVNENIVVEAQIFKKDGAIEKYDLKDDADEAKLEKKYGKLPLPPEPPTPPVKKPVSLLQTGGLDNLSALCEDFEITDKKAVMHLKNGETELYDLANIAQRSKFEKKYGRLIKTGSGSNEAGMLSPVAVVNNGSGYSAIAPLAPLVASGTSLLAIDRTGYIITGDEDVLVTITKKTKPDQLEAFKKQMKEKGIELKFENIDYNDGILVSISGSMKSKDGHSNFSATDFNKLVLAIIKDGDRTYFKVNVKDNKIVI